MDVVILAESEPGERRVAAVPETVRSMTGDGLAVHVEAGAGRGAGIPDDEYRDAGAAILPVRGDAETLRIPDGGVLPPVVLKVRPPASEGPEREHELEALPRGSLLVGFLQPGPAPSGEREAPDPAAALSDAHVTGLAVEKLPRTTRAQPMDALSSQATAAGYRAVTLGAGLLDRFIPMLTTAAGTIPPARVLVLGAGVAGLQAIATARRLGGLVRAFDIRPAVKEQVESLGAEFLEAELEEDAEAEGGYARELDERQQERNRRLVAEALPSTDLLVTTAQIPGRPAPTLVTDEMLSGMRPGTVVVDLAASTGGNVEGTVPGETVERNGVRVVGPLNPAADLARDASRMYARNLLALLRHVIQGLPEELRPEGEGAGPEPGTPPDAGPRPEAWPLDLEDPIVSAVCIAHQGAVRTDEAPSPVAGGPSEGDAPEGEEPSDTEADHG